MKILAVYCGVCGDLKVLEAAVTLSLGKDYKSHLLTSNFGYRRKYGIPLLGLFAIRRCIPGQWRRLVLVCFQGARLHTSRWLPFRFYQ